MTTALNEVYAKNPKAVAAWPAFDALRRFMSMGLWESEAFTRAYRSVMAVHEFRYAVNQRADSVDDQAMTVRIAAETFADQIIAAGQGEYDDRTLRWVEAGLRCRLRPFCRGCESCQTVTAPERAAVLL